MPPALCKWGQSCRWLAEDHVLGIGRAAVSSESECAGLHGTLFIGQLTANRDLAFECEG